jgi:hypothetical protein
VALNVVDSAVKILVYKSSTSGGVEAVTPSNIVANTWHHVTAIYDANTRKIAIALDGVFGAAIALEAASNYTTANGSQARFGVYSDNINSYAGYLDEFRITRGTVRYNSKFQTPLQVLSNSGPAIADQYYNNVVLLAHMTGPTGSTSIIDTSSYNKTLTAAGNAAITNTQSKFGGGSLVLDSTGDWVSVPGGNDFAFGNGDFTIECWVYKSTLGDGDRIIIDNSNNDGLSTTPGSWQLNIQNNQQIGFYYNYYAISNWFIAGTVSAFPASQWVHLAVVRAGNQLGIAINGVFTWTTNSVNFNYSSSVLSIGGSSQKSDRSFNGYIDDVRITKGVARYRSDFTVPAKPFPDYGIVDVDSYYSSVALLLHTNGSNGSTTFTDSSSNSLSITRTGSVAISTVQGKFGDSSAYFDGSETYLTVPASSLWNLGTSDFTVEYWIYPTVVGGAVYRRHISGELPTQSLVIREDSGALRAFIRTGSTSITQINGSTNVIANTWQHIALVRSGSTFTLYLNGSSIGTMSSSGAIDLSTAGFTINSTPGGESFTGYMDEVRFTKGVARYINNFIVPSMPSPDIGITLEDQYYYNVVLSAHMNGVNGSTTTVDSSSIPKQVTMSSSAALSTTKVKYGPTSLYLPGGGSTVNVPYNPAFDFGTGDFTVEFWMNSTQTADGWITGYYVPNPLVFPSQIWILSNFSGSMYFNLSSSTADNLFSFGTASSAADGNWHHVAFTRSSGTVRCFLDGIVKSTATYSAALQVNTSSVLRIGGVSGTYEKSWTGYIDDYRITAGVARYTANFTPPTQQFPDG